jgi:HNH endonuclease
MTAAAPADIEERLAVIVGQLNALHAQLVDLVAEARATGAWSGVGVRSLTHWLTWKAGVSNPHAAQLVRLADARDTHPRITEAFAAGRLTVDQAAIAVKVPPYADRQVAEMAPLATVNQLHTIVRCSKPVVPKPPEEPTDSVSSWFTEDGRYHLTADLGPDRGRVVDAALSAARDRLRAEGGARPTWVDALLDVAERSLDTEERARHERFRVNLFIDPSAAVPATWADGTPVPPAIREHLTCDGHLTPVFTDGAHPVSVGRARRKPPERTRRLVLQRDKACRAPWCGARRHLDVHHLDHWAGGGRTDYERLIALCSGCHRAHHHGLLGISGDPLKPDGLVFTDERGRVITGQPRSVPPAAPPPEPDEPYEHPLGERLSTRDTGAALPDPPQHGPPSAGVA